MREVRIESLKPGDLVGLDWADAWKDGKVPLEVEEYDFIWHEVGIFLYFAGSQTKHMILAYSKAPGEIEKWTVTAIPVSLIKRVLLIERGYAEKALPGLLEKLRNKVRFRIPKRTHRKQARVKVWKVELP